MKRLEKENDRALAISCSSSMVPSWLSSRPFTHHDAANRPDVDSHIVFGVSQQKLWCTIPARGNVIGKIIATRPGNSPRKAKVTKIERVIGIDEEVFRFDCVVGCGGRRSVQHSTFFCLDDYDLTGMHSLSR